MITRILGCGDVLKYLGGNINSNGKQRQHRAQPLRGSAKRAAALLAALAPFDLRNARRRRWFYQIACTHIVHNFFESRETVEPLILPIIRHTEDLMLAGMRRDAVSFASFYHPQELHPHPHIVPIKFVLPFGGAYHPNLHHSQERELLDRYTHVVNLKFGLEDPCDPKHARLIRPGRGSFKDKFVACFQEIEALAHAQLRKGLLTGKTFPLLLASIGVKPLVVYPSDSQVPVYFPAAWSYGIKNLVICRDALVVLTPDNQQMVLRGMLARPDFTVATWQEELERRRRFMEFLRNHPLEYYREFLALIVLRADRQRQAYPHAGLLGRRVGPQDFGQLEPASPKIIMTLQPRDGQPIWQQPEYAPDTDGDVIFGPE